MMNSVESCPVLPEIRFADSILEKIQTKCRSGRFVDVPFEETHQHQFHCEVVFMRKQSICNIKLFFYIENIVLSPNIIMKMKYET